MGMDIVGILKGIGTAATNPLAFVSYVFAVIGWFVLRSRVERNKNLLGKLSSLPEKERAPTLLAEMGVPSLKEGLSPEQWIRSRNNTYYFLSFVVLCAVLVILFAISAFTHNTEATTPTYPPPRAEDPNQSFMKAVDEMDLGLHKDFIISKFGEPPHVYKWTKGSCSQYRFPFATVNFMFDGNDDVVALYVIKRIQSYRPDFWTHYSWTHLGKGQTCLGCFSFKDATSELDSELKSVDLLHWNFGASDTEHFPDIYAERMDGTTDPKTNRVLALVYTSHGVADPESDNTFIKQIVPVLREWQNWQGNQPSQSNQWELEFDAYLKQLPQDERQEFLEARGHLTPNAFVLVTDSENEASQFPELNDIFREGDLDNLYCSF